MEALIPIFWKGIFSRKNIRIKIKSLKKAGESASLQIPLFLISPYWTTQFFDQDRIWI